ncbi:beta-xylosidase 2 [Prunus dulcis]|uniref:Beta-xylosidase 2 n=1 Tax=Prunus dulcis TaxID=3755 RepID=A0A4Y1RQC8_PRUDU|nr:beta-xylosidase 2 [Prunus dulcis]
MTRRMAAASISLICLFLVLGVFQQSCQGSDSFACNPKDARTKDLPFCRVTLPIQDRVRDLLARLTLQEKVKLLVNAALPVPRLGIKGYEWWSEALHGVSNVGPEPSLVGTSLGPLASLKSSQPLLPSMHLCGKPSDGAMYNGGVAGLTFWSPNVNILRDPRWGRGQETPGEDPLVVGRYAASYVRGLQGNDGNRLKVAACCKHFTAYDLDNWNGVDRFHFNARVSKQDMEETFDVPFKMCVKEGKVASVMCSYNQVNGVPTCADPNLLKKTVRAQWRLDGYIVSDCDSVGVFYDSQHYTSTPEEAAADAIKAGLDLDCGPFLGVHSEEAVKKGLLKEVDINNALVNTVTVQMRLGMFDDNAAGSSSSYARLGPKDVCSPAHQDLALEAATQGIVLLKNHGPSLPLSTRRHRTLAVIGPNSDATLTMIGNYAGVACGYTTPLQGLGKYASSTLHQPGCADVACANDTLFGAAIDAARQADATVLVMGLDQSIEAEFRDRVGLLLPGRQQDLVSKVAAASKGPTVLVLMSGGPIDVSFANNDPRIGGILWAGYPGQAGGTAIARVLFGTTNPGGKLPMTWYPQEYLRNLAMTAMEMRFYKGPVVYPFGHGLSYTKFVQTIPNNVPTVTVVSIALDGRHHTTSLNKTTTTTINDSSSYGKAIRVTHAKCSKLSVGLDVDVRNVGNRDGSHTLLVLSSPPRQGGWAPPHKQLVAFEKVYVPPTLNAESESTFMCASTLALWTGLEFEEFQWDDTNFILVTSCTLSPSSLLHCELLV